MKTRSVTSWFTSQFAAIGGWLGSYNSTDPTRKILGDFFRVKRASANEALAPVYGNLVAQCRQLVRNAPVAKAVCHATAANLVGSGIGILPQTGDAKLDRDLLDAFNDWAEYCGIHGESLWELQNMAARELGPAGASIWRFVMLPERMDEGKLPLAILALDAEWLSDTQCGNIEPGNIFMAGLEMDSLGRVVAYHIRQPDGQWMQSNLSKGERVPAEFIVYNHERERANQALGEPSLAPVVEIVKQDCELIRIELRSATIAAAPALAIKTEGGGGFQVPTGQTPNDAGQTERTRDFAPGSVVELAINESVEVIKSDRPSQGIGLFRGTLRGDVAAACRVSQQSLDRDSSRANYSSMRSDQMETQRTISPLRHCVERNLASRPYIQVLPFLLVALGKTRPANPYAWRAMQKHQTRPDKPGYVDPQKDAAAADFAVKNGLDTRENVLAERGKNIQDVDAQRAKELQTADLAVIARIKAIQVAVKGTDIPWQTVIQMTSPDLEAGIPDPVEGGGGKTEMHLEPGPKQQPKAA